LINNHCEALAIASGLIGGPQVRNMATIGGNVAHALPAADGTIALFSLNAQAEVASQKGRRRVALVDLFKGPGLSTLDPKHEILTGFYVAMRNSGQASSFSRIMRPQGVAIAVINMAIWLWIEQERILDIRVAVGPSGPIPRRMNDTENFLYGKSLSESLFTEAHQILIREASFRTSHHRATTAYREKMSRVLLEETVMTAFGRALISRERTI
jgi:carbon-monoxide dehydrogenase medium subunit